MVESRRDMLPIVAETENDGFRDLSVLGYVLGSSRGCQMKDEETP
jgi:hypothetical protein